MNKRSVRIFGSVFTVILLASTLTSCTDSEDSNTPEPTKTLPPPVEESLEQEVEPTPEPTFTVDVNDIAIRMNSTANENEWLTSSQVKAIIEEYTTAQLDPYFMSGTWIDSDGVGFSERFDEIFSDDLLEEISALEVTNADNSRLIDSLAAVMNPHGGLVSVETCNEEVGFRGCLAGDVIITDVHVSESDVNEETAKITFTMSTSRLLSAEETMSISDIIYENTLWYDTTQGHVVSVQNSFTFAEVSPV